MPVPTADYFEASGVIRWLDVDPTFDPEWTAWATLRVYAYLPDLPDLVGDLRPFNFQRIAANANMHREDFQKERGHHGFVKDENLTIEQLRYAIGTVRTEQGRLRPLRLDKAMVGLYTINAELERQQKPLIAPRIILSAYNICGLSKAYAKLSKDRKESIKAELVALLGQSEIFVSELLKGCKVSIDSAILAWQYLSKVSDLKDRIPAVLRNAIETPSMRHTVAAQFEDFSIGRLPGLPAPFRRPKRQRL